MKASKPRWELLSETGREVKGHGEDTEITRAVINPSAVDREPPGRRRTRLSSCPGRRREEKKATHAIRMTLF